MDKSVNMMLIQLKSNEPEAKPKLSTKYKGIISKEEGQKLNDHINQMRSEWNNI